jgi:hypothetical protein
VQSSEQYHEKRKNPRFSLDMPVEYRIRPSPRSHAGIVANASQNGLLIRAIRSMAVGTTLNLTVLFPSGFELNHFDGVGEIIWRDPCWNGGWRGYHYGISLTRILRKDSQKLGELLHD